MSATSGWPTSRRATTSASTSTAEIIDAIPGYVEQVGHAPELVAPAGQPACCIREIEERLTELLGCEDSLILPTITHIHMSVIPVLAAGGTIFMDSRAHKTIYDGCQFAVARGATLQRFRFEDPDDLERLLGEDDSDRRLVVHGRRQQHDRQRSRPGRVRPRRPPRTTPCSTSTTPTASA